MISLSGMTVDKDIQIKVTGLRPGEKLYEELLIGDDISETVNPKIMRAKEKMLYWIDLKEIVEEMRTSINSGDYEKIKELLLTELQEIRLGTGNFFKPQRIIVMSGVVFQFGVLQKLSSQKIKILKKEKDYLATFLQQIL